MSTRSLIGFRNPDSSFDFIYCHNDGYLEHNGILLYSYVKNIYECAALLNIGNVSSLSSHKQLQDSISSARDKQMVLHMAESYVNVTGNLYAKPYSPKEKMTHFASYADLRTALATSRQDIDLIYFMQCEGNNSRQVSWSYSSRADGFNTINWLRFKRRLPSYKDNPPFHI